MEMLTAQGMRMPKLGLGTWRLSGDGCQAAVLGALEIGYRHLDTAEMYHNEAEIGIALARSGLPRNQLHLTSKVHPEHLAPARLLQALEQSLQQLRTDYLDLYLIHWPSPGMDLPATLGAMMDAREQGLIRAIGVSNFNVTLMREAVEGIGAPIACNQVEYHVMLNQTKVLQYARSHEICVVAYSPLAQGGLEHDPVLTGIGRKHGASPSQVGLKWLLDQPNVGAVPKAARPETQQANLDALKLELDDEDRALIAMLPQHRRLVQLSWAPLWD